MAGTDDKIRHLQVAPIPGGNPVDCSFIDASTSSKSRVRAVRQLDVGLQSHADSFIGFRQLCKVKNVGSMSAVKSVYPLGMAQDRSGMTDEEIAREVLREMYPSGKMAQGARDTGLDERLIQRICRGGPIKGSNMALLTAYSPFSEAFRRAKKESEPQIDRATKATMGRIARAVGPRLLKAIAVEIEDLAGIVGGEKTLNAIERLAETAREVSESARESSSRQKD